MIITRFAPSPTGSLHIGGARTALFCWLYAQKENGKFILRIEDTDTERSTDAASKTILDGMKWLGLNPDEKPIYQSSRTERYTEIAQALLDEKKAYKCYCSKERLDNLRQKQLENKENPKYDGNCLNVKEDKDSSFVIRFKNDTDGCVSWVDAVKGEISISNSELDDLIIVRQDGSPTYNFCAVVDDTDMNITHVIRGDDHTNNTPKQINIYKALNKDIPIFAHIPMILGADGKKLSKRHGAISVLEYREKGYLPQAVLNYLVRLGWSHGDQEIFSMSEMIEYFDLSNVNNSAAIFDYDKLNWINQIYMRTMKVDEMMPEIIWHFNNQNIDIQNGPDLNELIPALAEKVNNMSDLASSAKYFFNDFNDYNEKAVKKFFNEATSEILDFVCCKLNSINDDVWLSNEDLHKVIVDSAEALKIGVGKVGMPIRIAITGSSQSPSIGLTIKLLGKDKVLMRINKTIKYLKNNY